MEDKDIRLYPFSVEAVREPVRWGSETWHLADLGFRDSRVDSGPLEDNTISEIMETYMDRITGDSAYSRTGRLFPVMVKTFRTESRSPLFVCPDDMTASERYDSLGKAKIWYVTGAEEDACLFLGLGRSMSATDFYGACLDGSIFGVLNAVPVKKGDCFLIAPGILHCAGPGLGILEISESSDLDFRLCEGAGDSCGRGEDIFLEEAFDFICMEASSPVMTGPDSLAGIDEFSARRLVLESPVRVADNDGYTVYHCVGGSFSIQTADEDGGMVRLSLPEGGTAVVPADVRSFLLVPESAGCTLVEIREGISSGAEDDAVQETEEE